MLRALFGNNSRLMRTVHLTDGLEMRIQKNVYVNYLLHHCELIPTNCQITCACCFKVKVFVHMLVSLNIIQTRVAIM